MSDHHFRGPLAEILRLPPELVRPDPWPAEVDASVRELDAVPLCLNCLQPQSIFRPLCPHCGEATDEFVAYSPILQANFLGDLFRRGTRGAPEIHWLRTPGFVLASVAQYGAFAPFYWYRMIVKITANPIAPGSSPSTAPEETIDDEAPKPPSSTE